MAKKTFNEKLNYSGDLPKVEVLTSQKLIDRYRAKTMAIAAPLEYDVLMKSIPAGKLITIDRMMKYLARQHQADVACPMTAGIFVNLAAKASEERGGIDETPYWRTLKKDGELNEKYPDGIDAQKARLEMEGHTVVQKGKHYFVKDYEKNIFELEAD